MSEDDRDGNEHVHHHPHHHHACANLFGCGDEKGTGIIREDIKDAAFDSRCACSKLQLGEKNGDFHVGAIPS